MNAGNPKVIEFIYRRFANTEAKWDDGNCYWFAEILVTRFPDLEIVYFPVPGHFMAKGKFEGEEYVYDINGGRK